MNNRFGLLSFQSPPNSSWILPFLLGASASLSAVLLSKNWAWSPLSPRKSAFSENKNAQSSNDADVVIDHEQLDNRMLRKAEAVIQWRTSRIILVVERCTNDHNYSAILRTAEALGIQTVYIIDPPEVRIADDDDGDDDNNMDCQRKKITRTKEEIEQLRLHHLFARNATDWLTVKDFVSSEECVECCRKDGYALWVTDLSQEAEALDVYAQNSSNAIPDKIALVFGTEAVGASTYLLEQADKRIYLPLRGFADSLNLSVATALVTQALFFMDPTLIGSMSESERQDLRKAWFTKLAQQRILSSSQKKKRKNLMVKIKKCQSIYNRTQDDPNYHVQPSEQKRLDEWPSYERELNTIESAINPAKVQEAIQEWINHPPKALTDLRRADTHRVCFVGKNTKEFHREHWKDMVATSNKVSFEGVTANTFREKMAENSSS